MKRKAGKIFKVEKKLQLSLLPVRLPRYTVRGVTFRPKAASLSRRSPTTFRVDEKYGRGERRRIRRDLFTIGVKQKSALPSVPAQKIH